MSRSHHDAARHDLPRSEWRRLLDDLTTTYARDDVTIELLTEDYGDQLEAERLPLSFLEYDPKDDAVIVGVGGRDGRYPVVLRHIVDRPSALFVDTKVSEAHPAALEVDAPDGSRTLITLHRRGAG